MLNILLTLNIPSVCSVGGVSIPHRFHNRVGCISDHEVYMMVEHLSGCVFLENVFFHVLHYKMSMNITNKS